MSDQPIRIGYCLSLTGPLASNGKTARLAHQIWENDVNRNGGLLGRKLQMVCIGGETHPKLVFESGFLTTKELICRSEGTEIIPSHRPCR